MPSLHPGQAIVRRDPARFKVLACGRRWGKTRLGVALCLATAASGGRAWWVAPSFPVASIGWREIKRLARQVPGYTVREADRIAGLPSGGWVQVKSADNPDSLRGEGLDFVVMDECAFIQEDAWTSALRPALSDRQGGALFISTPHGHNWFWRMFHGDEVSAHQFPTSANPFIDADEIEAARSSLPERVFAQEYLAQFIEDAGGVFRRVLEAAIAQPQERLDGHQYVAGVDVAQAVDFTVCSVFDVTTKTQVYQDRFNRVDYAVLEDRLAATYQRYKMTTMIVESNSAGQPVIENLARRGMNITPFTTTNATKDAIIRQLQSAFEHSEIGILNDPILIGELQSFEVQRTASGLFRYSAPDGMHDDCVMAAALAWNGIAERVGPLIAW